MNAQSPPQGPPRAAWPRKPPASDPRRERTITRLAVLKAAAAFAATRADATSGDVLKVAARWEVWVNR